MDDFTTTDMGVPDDDSGDNPLNSLLRSLGIGGGEPDPAEVRAHQMGHLTGDLSMDPADAEQIMLIVDQPQEADDSETPESFLRKSVSRTLLGALSEIFHGIHFAERTGAPLDAIMDPEVIRRCLLAGLGAWRLAVDATAEAAGVEVPDDVSALVE
jgi:hypothetical protein